MGRFHVRLRVMALVAAFGCTGCMATQDTWESFKGEQHVQLRVKPIDLSMPTPTLEWIDAYRRSGSIALAPPLDSCDAVTVYLDLPATPSVVAEVGKGDLEWENGLRRSYPADPVDQSAFEAIPDARCGVLLTYVRTRGSMTERTEIRAATVDGEFYSAATARSPRPEWLFALPFAVVVDVVTSPLQVGFAIFMSGWSH